MWKNCISLRLLAYLNQFVLLITNPVEHLQLPQPFVLIASSIFSLICIKETSSLSDTRSLLAIYLLETQLKLSAFFTLLISIPLSLVLHFAEIPFLVCRLLSLSAASSLQMCGRSVPSGTGAMGIEL